MATRPQWERANIRDDVRASRLTGRDADAALARSVNSASYRQRRYLRRLLGREPDPNLSKSDASTLIQKALRERKEET